MDSPKPPPDDDAPLDIELGDEEPEPLPPVAPAGPVLEITLEDLQEEPAGDLFPALTSEQVKEAEPGIVVNCVCSATRGAFEVRFAPGEPGVFWATEATKVAPKAVKGGAGEPGGAFSQTAGEFRMGPDYRCPHCGDPGLSICSACGVVLCLGGTGKRHECPCPSCGAALTPGGAATSAPTSGGKGKWGKKG